MGILGNIILLSIHCYFLYNLCYFLFSPKNVQNAVGAGDFYNTKNAIFQSYAHKYFF